MIEDRDGEWSQCQKWHQCETNEFNDNPIDVDDATIDIIMVDTMESMEVKVISTSLKIVVMKYYINTAMSKSIMNIIISDDNDNISRDDFGVESYNCIQYWWSNGNDTMGSELLGIVTKWWVSTTKDEETDYLYLKSTERGKEKWLE